MNSLSSGSSEQQHHRRVEIYLFSAQFVIRGKLHFSLAKKKECSHSEREKIVDNEVEKKKLNARELMER